jgi:hypothetical protein
VTTPFSAFNCFQSCWFLGDNPPTRLDHKQKGTRHQILIRSMNIS